MYSSDDEVRIAVLNVINRSRYPMTLWQITRLVVEALPDALPSVIHDQLYTLITEGQVSKIHHGELFELSQLGVRTLRIHSSI